MKWQALAFSSLLVLIILLLLSVYKILNVNFLTNYIIIMSIKSPLKNSTYLNTKYKSTTFI